VSAAATASAPAAGPLAGTTAIPLLELNNVEVVYDNVSLAVKGISMSVPAGGLVALLGANGAGKSTVLKSISGLLAAERGKVSRGDIRWQGVDMLNLSPPDRVRLGLVHVLEGRRVFEHLTPAENLLAAASMHRDRRHVQTLIDRVFEWFPRLAERAKAQAGYLSGGEQQMLAIGRALMTEPRLLMLDEPSLGLAPMLVDEIFDIIVRINAEAGVSILLVEQNAAAALEVAHSAYLIEQGRVVMNGPAAELAQNPDVQEFYLGAGAGVDYQAVKHYRRRKRWLT
jgi:branched-chain amino acid transport system ATP-binding protein